MAVKNSKYSLFLSVEFIMAVPSWRLYGMWKLVAWYLGTFASDNPTASLSSLIEFLWRKFYLKKEITRNVWVINCKLCAVSILLLNTET